MKRALVLVVSLCMVGRIPSADGLPPKELLEATDAYFKAMDTASADYRKVLAQVIGKADKIEICLIHLNLVDQDRNRFPLAPNLEDEFSSFGGVAKILKRKVLGTEEMERLLPLLQATVAARHPGEGGRCHDPIHGIRAWHGKELIFQGSFCYVCQNLYTELPGGGRLVGLTQPDFEKVMGTLMPIPEKVVKEDAGKKKKQPNKKD